MKDEFGLLASGNIKKNWSYIFDLETEANLKGVEFNQPGKGNNLLNGLVAFANGEASQVPHRIALLKPYATFKRCQRRFSL